MKRQLFSLLFLSVLLMGFCALQVHAAAVSVTVLDSVSKQPVSGAAFSVSASNGGITIPFSATTTANGVAAVDTQGYAPVLWSVSASGYVASGGSGSPPSTVYLVSLSGGSVSPSGHGASWLTRNWVYIALAVAVSVVAVVVLDFVWPRKRGR